MASGQKKHDEQWNKCSTSYIKGNGLPQSYGPLPWRVESIAPGNGKPRWQGKSALFLVIAFRQKPIPCITKGRQELEEIQNILRFPHGFEETT